MSSFDKEKFIERTWMKGLSGEAIRAAASMAQLLHFDDGHYLFRRGDKPFAFYIVVTGAVRFTRVNRAGKEMILNVVAPGTAFGEISIMGSRERSYTAQCIGDTALIAIGADELRRLFETHHDLRWRIVERLCSRINQYYESFDDFLLLKLPARIAKRIVALAEAREVHKHTDLILDAGLSQEDLASMLGISRQSLSKQLHEWQDCGWIDVEYGKIVIHNLAALKLVSEG
jgi:CRP/FNR family cyclic AMP-dependent transcriptional regulator